MDIWTIVYIAGRFDDVWLEQRQFFDAEELRSFIHEVFHPVNYDDVLIMKNTEIISDAGNLNIDLGRIK